MEELTVSPTLASKVCWDHLEAFARQQIQGFLQQLLEEEITALLGRAKSQRREPAPEQAPGGPETA